MLIPGDRLQRLELTHGIGPWYCNKTYLQVNNFHAKVGMDIHG